MKCPNPKCKAEMTERKAPGLPAWELTCPQCKRTCYRRFATNNATGKVALYAWIALIVATLATIAVVANWQLLTR